MMMQFIRDFLCYLYSFNVPSNKIPGNETKKYFLAAAKSEEERKEMMTREINAIERMYYA